jgi:hypothetical protein
MYLRFKITNTTAGFPYDSIRMNFAAGYQSTGNQQTSTLGSPHASWVQLVAGANNLVTGNIIFSNTIPSTLLPQVVILDSITNALIVSRQLSSDGNFSFSTELQPNTKYKLYVVWKADSLAKLSAQATTVSDYTAAYQEFLTQNLDGTYKNNNLTRAVRYKAADVSKNNVFDGGDVQLLFNAVVGLDTILKKPAGATNSWDYESVYIFPVSVYDTLSAGKWNSTVFPNHYGFSTTNANQQISLKYLLLGDPNLSMSSPLTSGYNLRMSSLAAPMSSIDVNLTNTIVTTNTITIPFDVDTKGTELSALQFQVEYDTTKVKFDKLLINTPSWISFATPSSGVLRFGAIDRDMKNPISGKVTPFKIQFISLENGADINSSVTISPIYDGADSKGNQVAINLNTTVVKLIGANNFKTP